MRIGEIAATSGLPQSTCFRMLHRLEAEGLVDRDAHTRKYYLGPLLYELGLLARPRYRLSELCDSALQKLAEVTQDTIYLSERSGLEAVCTHRALGDYPIKSLALDVGIRRPLGVGAGGLAILCALPPDEAESIIDANAPKYEKYGFVTAPTCARRSRWDARRAMRFWTAWSHQVQQPSVSLFRQTTRSPPSAWQRSRGGWSRTGATRWPGSCARRSAPSARP